MGRFSIKSRQPSSGAIALGESSRLKDFLQLFVPIAILVAAGTWTLGESRIHAELSMLMADEKTYVNLSQGRLEQELALPIRHLVSLASEKPVRRGYEDAQASDLKPMEEAFLSLVSRNPPYDKVRWIDERGRERLRVNNNGGQPYLVPQDELKDQRDRYYFADTMRLDRGVVYVSPLDLNMENGEMETPYKPMLRVATPVFNADGNRRGILIINIAARSLLDAFVGNAGPAADRMTLVNADGYWLKGPNEADELGFMFRRQATLDSRYPEVWEAVSKEDHGQITLPDGLWTWSSVSPAAQGDTRLSHSIHWNVIAHLPESDLSALEHRVWPAKIAGALVILSLFGFGISRLVQAKLAHARAERDAALARSEAKAAQRLQEAQASFQMLFEANTSGLLVVNAEGRIVMVNPAFGSLFGYSISELLGKPIEMLLPERDRANHAEHRSEYLHHPTSRAMGSGRDLFGTRKDGKVFPIEIGLSAYRDNNQDYVLATIVDISERKRAQDELRRMNEVLEQRVVERTVELQAARLDAERLANVKGNFLANMSHEIRTPMNAILGLAYLLEKAKLGPEEHSLVKQIRIAGRSLLGIINDILDFSKIESGHLEIEHLPFRLNDVLDNVATLMSAVEYKQDVEFIMGPAPEGVEILRGDALRLEQVLINLISNALKFTDRGCVTLTVTCEPTMEGRDFLRFNVLDTGKGIAADKQMEIFNAFTQEDTSTTRRFGGTGLGLSICRRLVKLMGGEIGVVSELGKGSEFWFTLPLERVEPQDYVQPAMTFQNVLIAEDHPVAREMLAATIRSLGWNPEVVASGEEAVQRILSRAENNKLPDILLLDWRMPGMDGLEAGQRIKKILGDLPNAPLIVMATAHDRESLVHAPGADVADAILNKPVTASALYNVVFEAKRRQLGKTFCDPADTLPHGGQLGELSVLVVDDSEINRDMAQRILVSESATVYLVNDGLAAVEWLQANPDRIDVVLMDIQMPVMDGYEATRQIRETLGLKSLPIIALTAGAFKNQQAAALAAGMNGFVAKPFDVEDLIRQLRQYAKEPQQENVTSAKAETSSATDKGVTQVIDFERGLRLWGDVDTYYKYLSKFVEAHGRDGDQIIAMLARGALTDGRALAHKLKGTAANMAIMVVWELAKKIERTLIEGGQTGEWPKMLQGALDDVSGEIARLSKATSANDGEISGVTDSDSPLPLLWELLRALDKDSPDEAEPSLRMLEKILPSQMLKPIRDSLDNFDFRSAEEQTNSLIKQLNSSLEEV